MDQVMRYRQIIQKVLEDYAAMMSMDEIKLLPVCDTNHDQYLLITLGWMNQRREHAICFHAQLLEHTVKIEVDLTEEGLAGELIESGIAATDIQAAWIPCPQNKGEEAMAA
jgi:hypothetical protein